MSPVLGSKSKTLATRAKQLARVRQFFSERDVLEVDVGMLKSSAPVDCHIDLIIATVFGKKAYLHSSPEYGMKRLLSMGLKDIYQLSHVFRDGEVGRYHLPEFMMIEWYRLGFSLEQMMDETLQLCQLFIDDSNVEKISYDDAFRRYLQREVPEPKERDELFALELQSKLGRRGFEVIFHFPEDCAALSKVVSVDGKRVAKRFEIFYHGVELANGYEELTDAKEQRRRLLSENQERAALGKECYPLDDHFLDALERGIVPCSGVAVGFDRLMMCHLQRSDITEVVAFPWE